MDKLKMHSVNKVDENIAKIGKLFPNCLTERKNENGVVEYAIDFDMLKQELSSVVVEGNEERYQFTWPDKKKSILLANAPIAKTLRPCREESVDFDTTENLYIEGDNLDVLKLLQETYLGKIKMIYIDPPYNTGKDFVYGDNFAQSTDEYLATSGQFDNEGNRLVPNAESNGRFHTDWLNMLYPRLKLAKDLLADDGVIFISIDDNEVENLKKVCNEIFGEQNAVSSVIWIKKYGIQNDAKYFSTSHDYLLVYAKNITVYKTLLLPRTAQQDDRYKNPDNDPRGPWKAADFTVPHHSDNRVFEITLPSGRKVTPAQGRSWGASQEEIEVLIKENRLWFGKDGNSVPSLKKFLTEVKNGLTPTTVWHYDDVGHTDKAAKDLAAILEKKIFDYPKPVDLIKQTLRISSNSDDIILDFFSGSATTAHAVMQLNAEDGGNRKFIMVQLPEETDEKSEAYKAGYKNICEIGKERIRRAGAKIQQARLEKIALDKHEYDQLTYYVDHKDECDRLGGLPDSYFKEHYPELDTGFRVLKLDSSNMKDVYYTPADYEMSMFDTLADNIKEDRTPEDLLFQVMLDLGVLLSSKIEESTIAGKKVFNVADGFLMACFDENVSDETITAIAKQKPYYFVMRDSSMASDSVATNFDQIFATYSPDTVRKVL